MLTRSDGEGITVQGAADPAGQPPRTLYHYFESKDDLMSAVFEETMRTHASLNRALNQRSNGSARETGRGMIAVLLMPGLYDAGIEPGLEHAFGSEPLGFDVALWSSLSEMSVVPTVVEIRGGWGKGQPCHGYVDCVRNIVSESACGPSF